MNKYEKYEIHKHLPMENQNNLMNKIDNGSDILLNRVKQKNRYSIKPFPYESQKDINLNEVFNQIINSHILFNGEDNIYIKLSDEQIIKRLYIIDSIKKFINLYKIKYEILYNIIFLFDILIFLDDKFKVIQDYEKIGLGSTILMIKYFHKEDKIVSLNKYRNLYEGKNIPKIIIKEVEILCLKLINYYLNFSTPLLFMELFFLNGFFFKSDNIKNDSCLKIYNLALIILEKIIIISNEYTKYSQINLCGGIISYCRQYYGLEKWPNILYKIFGIKEKDFENFIKEFLCSEKNINIKAIFDKNKLYDKRLVEKDIIFKRFKEINNKENNQNYYNEINFHHINKDIKVNKNNDKEEKVNSQINLLKFNNIHLNYRTTEEIKNSALFRKINIKFCKNLRDLNISNSLNNINQKGYINAIEHNLKTLENKISTKSYKTPDKIQNIKNPSSIYNQNKREDKYKNHYKHHLKNDTNITNVNKDNKFLDYKEEQKVLLNRKNINDKELKIDYYSVNKERVININKNEERKIFKQLKNEICDDINKDANLKENEEIKVKLKKYYYQKKNFNQHKMINVDSDLELGNHNKINNNIYKKSFLLKGNNSSMNFKITNNESNSNNILRKKSEDIFAKNIYLNRLSSCNNKIKSKIFNVNTKEEDYSNETTSENSYNISIRRNYYKLRRIKDSLLNIKNKDIISNAGNNIETNIIDNNESSHFIKCNVKNKMNNYVNENFQNNKESKSKIKDCLKIGSIDRKFRKKIDDNNIDMDYNQSGNKTKRIEIRSYYKLKKINKNL